MNGQDHVDPSCHRERCTYAHVKPAWIMTLKQTCKRPHTGELWPIGFELEVVIGIEQLVLPRTSPSEQLKRGQRLCHKMSTTCKRCIHGNGHTRACAFSGGAADSHLRRCSSPMERSLLQLRRRTRVVCFDRMAIDDEICLKTSSRVLLPYDLIQMVTGVLMQRLAWTRLCNY